MPDLLSFQDKNINLQLNVKFPDFFFFFFKNCWQLILKTFSKPAFCRLQNKSPGLKCLQAGSVQRMPSVSRDTPEWRPWARVSQSQPLPYCLCVVWVPLMAWRGVYVRVAQRGGCGVYSCTPKLERKTNRRKNNPWNAAEECGNGR